MTFYETIELAAWVDDWIQVLIIYATFYLGQHEWCLSIGILFLLTHWDTIIFLATLLNK